mgnify:FL=1
MVRGDEKSPFLVTYLAPMKSMNEGNILLMPLDVIAQLLSSTCARVCVFVQMCEFMCDVCEIQSLFQWHRNMKEICWTT